MVEAQDFCRPHDRLITEPDGTLKDGPGSWKPSSWGGDLWKARYRIDDGTVRTKKGKVLGRWFVEVGRHGYGDKAKLGKRIKPNKINDMLWLYDHWVRVSRHIEECVKPRYSKAEEALFAATDHQPFEHAFPWESKEGEVHYSSVSVNTGKHWSRFLPDKLHCSFSSARPPEYKGPAGNALQVLAHEEKVREWKEETLAHADLARAVDTAYRRQMKWWYKQDLAKQLLDEAIARLLPPPRDHMFAHGYYDGPTVRIRIRDREVYWALPSPRHEKGHSWSEHFVMPREEDMICLDFEWEGRDG